MPTPSGRLSTRTPTPHPPGAPGVRRPARRRPRLRRGALAARAAVPLVVLASLAAPTTAGASELIARDVSSPRLTVDDRGRALVTYREGGHAERVLAWAAVNARHPAKGVPQVRFRLRDGGGQGFRGACQPYDGPALAWAVTACKAPDGSYWALQSWHRLAPNYGARVSAGARDPRLSHWRGDLPVLEIFTGWTGGYHYLVGSYTYGGRPVHGFGATRQGSPLDHYGRNIYLDTLNSAYGDDWRRENSFLTRRPTGRFCYGFYPHSEHPSGMGQAYRATVIGPGVAPDVSWTGAPAAPGDRTIASRSWCR